MHVDGYWWKDVTHMPSGSVWTYGLENDLHRIAERAQGEVNLDFEEDTNVNHIDYYDKWATTPEAKQKRLAKSIMSTKGYALIVFPGEARQFYAAGMKTKEDLKKYIADYRRCPWEKLSPKLQEAMLVLAKSGDVPYLTEADCVPGGSVPMYDVNRLAIFVSGPMAGQTLGFFCMGSYDSFREDPPKSPWFTRKITGATMTKAGR